MRGSFFASLQSKTDLYKLRIPFKRGGSMIRLLSRVALVLIGFVQVSLAEIIDAKVLGVHDGDTMTVLTSSSSGKIRVRLVGIDTPEVDFNGESQGDWAMKARNRLAELAPPKSNIKIDVVNYDKFGRILGRVITANGVDANKQLLEEGFGVMYFIDPTDKGLLSDYVEAAESAELAQIGIYSPIYKGSLDVPYDFRLKVTKHMGQNYVANYKTKEVYSVGIQPKVHLSYRVFYSSLQMAQRHGYHLVRSVSE